MEKIGGLLVKIEIARQKAKDRGPVVRITINEKCFPCAGQHRGQVHGSRSFAYALLGVNYRIIFL